MRLRKLALIVAAVALAGVGPARAADKWEELLMKLYPDAKKEGEFIINVERIEEIGGKEGLEKFAKRFPGVKVSTNGQAGSTLAPVLIAEAAAGHLSIDSFRSDPNRAAVLAERKLLLPLNLKELADHEVKTYYDGNFVKVSDQLSNFAYNTDKIKEADRPRKFEDLLDPKLEKKIAMDARGGQIAHLLAYKVWEEKKFWDFVAGIKKQNPMWSARVTESIGRLAAGEASVSSASHAATLELQRQGATVDFLYLSPTLSQVRGIAIMKGAPHPAAAKLFLGWLLSPEGSEARDKNMVGMIEPEIGRAHV